MKEKKDTSKEELISEIRSSFGGRIFTTPTSFSAIYSKEYVHFLEEQLIILKNHKDHADSSNDQRSEPEDD